MSIGLWQFGILILLFFPSLIALILCLILIKKRNYKKIPKNKIYAGFWHRFLAYLSEYFLDGFILQFSTHHQKDQL